MFRKHPLVASILLGFAALPSAQAEPLSYSQTNSGEVGLVEMPTSRMYPEGAFGVHLSYADPYSRVAVIAQPLPWFQFLFKYTDISNRLYGEAIAGSQSYKDKSTDIKVRLFEESYYLPEVAVGVRDVGGTGLFSGEYVVLSKQIQNLDLSFGMGWGYLGQQGHLDNPLSLLGDSFDYRDAGEAGDQGGNISYSNFFSGEKVALFAGAEYYFESMPLRLKIEYDANDYQNEPLGNVLEQKSPINVGVVYSPLKGIDLQLGMVRGNEVYAGVTFRTNLKTADNPKLLDPKPVPVQEAARPDEADWPTIDQQLRANAGIDVERIEQQDQELYIYGNQKQYPLAKGVGRAARLLDNQTPDQIEQFHFVDLQFGLPVSQLNLQRENFHAAANLEAEESVITETTSFSNPKAVNDEQLVYQSSSIGQFNYDVSPYFSGSFGGPDAFLLYQLGLKANADYRLTEGLLWSGSLKLGLLDNYDNFEYQADSLLPRVRTSIRDYLKTSVLRMDNMQLSHFERLAPNWYASLYGGYLEWMYGGIGGELLYRPLGKTWALGLDANRVKQRDFDQGLGFRDYEVTTGHLTAYYQSQIGIQAKVSAGQYLAGDRGVTIDLSRQFKNGASIGVWATKTDVSAEEFGEGSFDKGFYFQLPLNLFSFKSTNEVAELNWRFLTRDGGQMLNRRYELYELTRSRDQQRILNSFDQILD